MKEQLSPTVTLNGGFISLAGSGWKAKGRMQEYREDC